MTATGVGWWMTATGSRWIHHDVGEEAEEDLEGVELRLRVRVRST